MNARLLTLLLVCATAANACSSCSTPDNGDGATARSAYYATAIFMTLLPGVLVLLLVRWIRRQEAMDHHPHSRATP